MPQAPNLYSDPDKYQLGMGGWTRTLAPLFVEFVGGIDEGHHVLDVGCGTGSLTFTVAQTSKASRIVGIDPSVEFLEFARANNVYPNVTFDTGSAESLPYSSASFDVCVSLSVINWVSDAHQAVKEMMRITKRYGRIATCMWDDGGGFELSQKFWDAAGALDPKLERVKRPYGSARALSDLWKSAGLENVATEALVIPMEFRSIDDLWHRFSNDQGPAKAYLIGLSPDRREVLKTQLHKDILGDRPDEPITLQAKAWAVKGIVPAA